MHEHLCQDLHNIDVWSYIHTGGLAGCAGLCAATDFATAMQLGDEHWETQHGVVVTFHGSEWDLDIAFDGQRRHSGDQLKLCSPADKTVSIEQHLQIEYLDEAIVELRVRRSFDGAQIFTDRSEVVMLLINGVNLHFQVIDGTDQARVTRITSAGVASESVRRLVRTTPSWRPWIETIVQYRSMSGHPFEKLIQAQNADAQAVDKDIKLLDSIDARRLWSQLFANTEERRSFPQDHWLNYAQWQCAQLDWLPAYNNQDVSEFTLLLRATFDYQLEDRVYYFSSPHEAIETSWRVFTESWAVFFEFDDESFIWVIGASELLLVTPLGGIKRARLG